MSDEITTAIETEAAAGIKSATIDSRTVVGRDLRELIEADQYLAEKQASAPSRRSLPIRAAKIIH